MKGLCTFKGFHTSEFSILKHCKAAIGHEPDLVICFSCMLLYHEKSYHIFNFCTIELSHIKFLYLKELYKQHEKLFMVPLMRE